MAERQFDPQQFRAMFDDVVRAATEWVESFRPALEKLAEIAQDPAVQAALASRAPCPVPCACLCSIVHSSDMCCEGDAVAVAHFAGRKTAMCAPCLHKRIATHRLLNGTQAMFVEVLEDEGLVYTVSGRGTFVTPRT